MATERPDWKLSKPAQPCRECQGTNIYPQAIWVGDGWITFWGCDLCGADAFEWDEGLIEWPFIDGESGNQNDLKSIGFTIV